ncbi:hypothetical protein [Pseudomonas nitroreducens]|uniref:hypothetical protein n=1 Tax=Pseudomonas nitroreducens TaxID=46680 RepID=UPI003CC8204F
MIYSGARSAVVAVMAAECIDNTAKQAWQRLYSATEIVSKGSGVSAEDRMEADCWVHARLHSELKPRYWNVLMARYSTHGARKVQAISAIAPLVASHAPQLFIYKAVTAWAIPQLPGARVERRVHDSGVSSRRAKEEAVNRAMSEFIRGNVGAEEGEEGAEYVAPQRDEYVVSAPDMILLPDGFYNMNTWDPDANHERTRRRWRKGIYDRLDEMAEEALAGAEAVLRAEGLLIPIAA